MTSDHDDADERREEIEPPIEQAKAAVSGPTRSATARAMSAAVTQAPLEPISIDAELSLEERLEAFEDLVDAEVGDTSLVRARNIERELDLRQLFLKFEGGNPTGTQKDRIAFAQVGDALRRGFDTVAVATCGNYGAAVALAARLAGIRCRVYIPGGYRTEREGEILDSGAEIVRVDGDYETTVAHSSREAARLELYDANPGGANTALQLRAYGGIATEIYDDLRDAPSAVAVSVSNGTTLAGIHRGFASLFRRGKTSHLPRMVAGSAYRKNPIVRAHLEGFDHCRDLEPDKIRETRINEPLINWHSSDGDQALRALLDTDGWSADASDRSMSDCSRMLREKEGLSVLPAATAGLVALLRRHQKSSLPPDRYVAVLTGRKA